MIRADGSGDRPASHTQITQSTYPSWSPDGTRLTLLIDRSIDDKSVHVINADGSGLTRVGGQDSRDGRPTWSPDGTRLVYHANVGTRWDIYTVRADGTDLTNLTAGQSGAFLDPDWSPDGTKIAYVVKNSDDYGIRTMHADGSGMRELVSTTRSGWQAAGVPLWSPDGQQILFRAQVNDDWNVWVINADGSGLTQLTDSPEYDGMAVWQPVSTTGAQPPALKPDTDDPIVGRWTWRNDFNSTWYVYAFASDGGLRITTESDANHLTDGTYRIVDSHTLGLTYTRSTEYLSSPGTESLWEFEITTRDVAYEGRTQRRTVLILTDKRGGEQVFIRLD
jgi:Tol biopolymer transport system component